MKKSDVSGTFSDTEVKEMPEEVKAIADRMHLKIAPTIELTALYFRDSEKLISEMRKEPFNELIELEDLSELVHSLKGMSQNLGLSELAALCEDIEVDIFKQNEGLILNSLAELISEHERVKVLCTDWLENTSLR